MSYFWNSPAWTMAQRPHSARTKKTGRTIPGPGNYNVSKDPLDVFHGCKIGTSNRNIGQINNFPGPGKYNTSSKISGPKITMGAKSSAHFKEQNVPGPGNYDLNFKNTSKNSNCFTMGAKYGNQKSSDSKPGPGSYNIESNKKSGVKIGTSNRQNQKTKQNVPGPGTYGQIIRPLSAGPHFSFGGGEKAGFDKNQFAPGPGHYNYAQYNSKNKGITLGHKSNQGLSGGSYVPGPGQYESLSKRPMSGTKIGKASRNLISQTFAPGPGAYDGTYNPKKGVVKIGTSQRHQMDKSQTPGPGAYSLYSRQKTGVTISGVKNKKNVEITPGPGAYNHEADGMINRPCSAKIGTGLRSCYQYSECPGPGTYNLNSQENWKFAYTKENRSKDLKINEPGPGQYDIPATVPSVPYYDNSVSKLGKSRGSQK